jgi:hypothetical protein
MRGSRLERFAPLSGVLAVVLIVVAFALFPDEIPEADESIGKIVDFWRDHDGEASASAIVWALSAVPFLWFAGSLRAALRPAEGGAGRLASIAFAGLVAFAIGSAVGAAIQFALAESADDLSPAAIEALNALTVNFWIPFIVGTATFLLASGVSGLRHRSLHPALAWTALLLGLLALTPVGFFAFLASGLWIVAASVALFLRAPATSPGSPS